MTTQHKHSAISTSRFISHLMQNGIFGLLSISVALIFGMVGYHLLEKMAWIDAFLNAAMILSGMGPAAAMKTNAGKLFAGFYALFSGLAFIVIIAIVLSPVIHRFFRNIHLEMRDE